MRFRAFLAFGWIFDSLLCSAMGADGPVTVQKIYVEKNVKNDLATEASGYIFRSDGDNPPILIKLGANNINQYEDVLKNAGKPYVFNVYSSRIRIKLTRFSPIASAAGREAHSLSTAKYLFQLLRIKCYRN